jgi:3-hydroxyisobutyrate dehydrogenase
MARIGFIGLGNMGAGMAANLVKAGHEVSAFDLSAAACNAAAAAGCTIAQTAADAARTADAVVTMLPTGAHVRDVVFGAGGVAKAAPAGALLIDCSTIAVEDARSLGEAAAATGLAFVDAPVSGGVAAATAGTLTFMVGGAQDAFAHAEPILAAMGKAVIHAGAAGAGQAAKVCNNMLLAISMIGTCEAFALAEKLGLDPQRFFDIASKSSGQCWSMTSYCPAPGPVPAAPSNRDFVGGFATALMLKDLRLALGAAGAVGAQVPLGAHAEALFAAHDGRGQGGRDFSSIIEALRASAA